MRLTREIRCFPGATREESPSLNNWAGSPSTRGSGLFWIVRATVEGSIDERTGYVFDITELDEVVLRRVVPMLFDRAMFAANGAAGLAKSLPTAFEVMSGRVDPRVALKSLELCVSPFLRFAVDDGALPMVHVTESFEFAAAHRLACPDFDDDENARVFGKCSHPNGHGHNYVLEVTVSGEPDAVCGTVIDPPAFQRVVKARVLDHFDHKHLNIDCEAFKTLNPSVENIARVIWERLEGGFDRGRLTCIRVWETAKTSAAYRGPD